MNQYNGIFTSEVDGELKLTKLEENNVELMSTTSNLNAIFGNPVAKGGGLSKTWAKNNLIQVKLPYPMVLAWDKSQSVNYVTFHKKAAPYLVKALTNTYNYCRGIIKQQYPNKTTAFYNVETLKYLAKYRMNLLGGTWAFRPIRGGTTLSNHARGLSIDIDPDNNKLGDHNGSMPMWMIKSFEDAGFTSGARWKNRPDFMHFELTHL